MKIVIIYSLVFFVFLLFFILSLQYKQQCKKNLPKKEHPLKIFYGLAFILIDAVSFLKKQCFPNSFSKNSSLKTKLEQLYPGKDSAFLEYIFTAKRCSYGILCFLLFLLLGFFYSISCIISKKVVTELPRGNEDTSYSLEVQIADEQNHIQTETIDVTIPAKEFDFKACVELFETYREGIITELLGENTDISSIQYPLHFLTSYGEEGLSISWEIENEELIDYSGMIYPENIETQGAATCVTANLSLGEYRSALTIPLILGP